MEEKKEILNEKVTEKEINESIEGNTTDKFVDELCKKNPVVGCLVGVVIGIGMIYIGYWLIARGFSRFFDSI